MNEDLKRNLTSKTTWVRLACLILFALIFSLVEMVLALCAVVQFLSVLFRGNPDPKIREFGVSLGRYAGQIARYQTFVSDERPFPFGDWPQAESGEDEDAPSGSVMPQA